jgi:GntR family transcriptional regulator
MMGEAAMFRRAPSLTEQVKIHLKEQIAQGAFNAGRIPSEVTLATDLNVSRNTVRDALSRLEMEGVIIRKHGAGTFVNEAIALVKTRLGEIVPYEEMIADQGYQPSIRTLRMDQELADGDLAREFGIEEGEELIVGEKIYLADGKPVIFYRLFMPQTIMTEPATEAAFQRPVTEFVEQVSEEVLSYLVSELVPLNAPQWLATALELPEETSPLISFEERGYNPASRVILKTYSYFRNDVLQLRLVRRVPR